jgi:GTPase SAR1 family protein
VGIDFTSKYIEKENTLLMLNITDTAGQEKYQAMAPNFFRSAIGALLVFDVTDR